MALDRATAAIRWRQLYAADLNGKVYTFELN